MTDRQAVPRLLTLIFGSYVQLLVVILVVSEPPLVSFAIVLLVTSHSTLGTAWLDPTPYTLNRGTCIRHQGAPKQGAHL